MIVYFEENGNRLPVEVCIKLSEATPRLYLKSDNPPYKARTRIFLKSDGETVDTQQMVEYQALCLQLEQLTTELTAFNYHKPTQLVARKLYQRTILEPFVGRKFRFPSGRYKAIALEDDDHSVNLLMQHEDTQEVVKRHIEELDELKASMLPKARELVGGNFNAN